MSVLQPAEQLRLALGSNGQALQVGQALPNCAALCCNSATLSTVCYRQLFTDLQ
jgi:hypothetical protein